MNILKYIKLLSIICLSIATTAKAQFTGIQTRNPASSALLDMDVSSFADGFKKGFLMTRVSLTRTNIAAPITSPKIGLWVFNTNTTTGLNAVTANNVYMWSGAAWEPYSSAADIQVRISPDDFFMKSPSDFLLTGSTLTTFNTSTLIPIPWESASIAIPNPSYITLNSDLQTFTVNKTGFFEISGFVNYNPKISSTSSKTALRLVLQVNKAGTWTDRIAVNSTFEENATNTTQTITIPFDIIKLDLADQFRFMITKPSGASNVDHASTAGITSIAGDLRKSFRITYIVTP